MCKGRACIYTTFPYCWVTHFFIIGYSCQHQLQFHLEKSHVCLQTILAVPHLSSLFCALPQCHPSCLQAGCVLLSCTFLVSNWRCRKGTELYSEKQASPKKMLLRWQSRVTAGMTCRTREQEAFKWLARHLSTHTTWLHSLCSWRGFQGIMRCQPHTHLLGKWNITDTINEFLKASWPISFHCTGTGMAINNTPCGCTELLPYMCQTLASVNMHSYFWNYSCFSRNTETSTVHFKQDSSVPQRL